MDRIAARRRQCPTAHFNHIPGADDAAPENIQKALGAPRPLGVEAVGLLFGQAMEFALRDLIASGRLASIRTHRKTTTPPDPAAE